MARPMGRQALETTMHLPSDPTNSAVLTFDTKIAIVVRDDLAAWQKLNVTAFLVSGVVGAAPTVIGEPYEDAAGNRYNPLCIQPMIVLGADAEALKAIHRRALERKVRLSIYIADMFATGHDAANRETVRRRQPDELDIVGLALRDDRKIVDKVTKGARTHR
jgi:hypothetical protein